MPVDIHAIKLIILIVLLVSVMGTMANAMMAVPMQ